jgi:hypothetical protein
MTASPWYADLHQTSPNRRAALTRRGSSARHAPGGIVINRNGSQVIGGRVARSMGLAGKSAPEVGVRGFFPGADDNAILTALAWDVDGFFCGAWGVERDERMDNSFRADPRAAYTVIGDQRATNLFTN